MKFTQEDYKNIYTWLQTYSKKDTDFTEATVPLNGDEELAFVQNGKNVKMSVLDLCNNLILFRAIDFINITEHDDDKFDLKEAIAKVQITARKPGVVITFIDKNWDQWTIYQFRGKYLTDWYDTDMWQPLFDNWKFKGYFANEYLLWALCSYPEIGDYAFVGETLKTAKVYRCVNKNQWSATTENVMDYVKVIIDGNITVGENGNWYQNGKDTGIKAEGPEGKTPILRYYGEWVQWSYDGVDWENLVNIDDFTIVNQADEEDIHTDEFGFLKFADKKYDEHVYSGLGRKFLRKKSINNVNVLLQEAINESNTRYIIQYDFDLQGATITIPENCVLDFQYGKLYNGTIVGNNTIIINNHKECLDDIQFDGTFLIDIIYWNEATKYIESLVNHSKLNTLYIEENSTVDINMEAGDIGFTTSDFCIKGNNATIAHLGFNKCSNIKIENANIEQLSSLPLIDQAIKQYDISIINSVINTVDTGNYIFNNCTIKNISPPSFLGYIFNYFIKNSSLGIVSNESTETGKIVVAHAIMELENCLCAHLDIRSMGAYLFKATSCIFENIDLSTPCCSLIDCGITNGGDINITGNSALSDSIITNTLINCKTFASSNIDIYNSTINADEVDCTRENVYNTNITADTITFHTCITVFGNIIDGAVHLLNLGVGNSICYFINNIVDNIDNIITVDQLANNQKLAIYNNKNQRDYDLCLSSIYQNNVYSDLPIKGKLNDITDNIIPQSIKYFNENGIGFKEDRVLRAWDGSELTVRRGSRSERPTLGNESYNKGVRFFDTTLNKPIYWNGSKWIDADTYESDKLRIGTTTQRPTGVPASFRYYDTSIKKMILWNGNEWVNVDGTNLTQSGGTSDRPTTGLYPGFVFYDSTLNKIIVWNGNEWITPDGANADDKTEGGSSDRPTNPPVGYVYYDIDLGKFIVWNGTEWVDYDGTQADLPTEGPTEDRPQNPPKGYVYYDETLGKFIYWNGSEWVLQDGTDADLPTEGTTDERPTNPPKGFVYYDETLGKFIYWDGTKWVLQDGTDADIPDEGTSDQRPTNPPIGFTYYDTTLKKFIYWDGTKWVDASGNDADTPSEGTDRPENPNVGTIFWDETLNKFLIWNGTIWIEIPSTPADTPESGPSTARPDDVEVGYVFNDLTLNRLVVWNGSQWVPIPTEDDYKVTKIATPTEARFALIPNTIDDGDRVDELGTKNACGMDNNSITLTHATAINLDAPAIYANGDKIYPQEITPEEQSKLMFYACIGRKTQSDAGVQGDYFTVNSQLISGASWEVFETGEAKALRITVNWKPEVNSTLRQRMMQLVFVSIAVNDINDMGGNYELPVPYYQYEANNKVIIALRDAEGSSNGLIWNSKFTINIFIPNLMITEV